MMTATINSGVLRISPLPPGIQRWTIHFKWSQLTRSERRIAKDLVKRGWIVTPAQICEDGWGCTWQARRDYQGSFYPKLYSATSAKDLLQQVNKWEGPDG